MRFATSFTVTLDVSDPIRFETDRENNALLQVRDVYQGRCYRGKYIIEVTHVKKISRCRINQVGVIGGGTVTVSFVAQCSRLHGGDAIAGMRILKRQQILVGQAIMPAGRDEEPATLTMINPNESIAEHQILPVRIIEIQYSPLQTEPSAVAELLTCRAKEKVWVVADEVATPRAAKTQGRIIDSLCSQLAEVLEERDRLLGTKGLAEVRTFFGNRLKTYRNETPLPAHFRERPLANIDDVQKWAAELKPGTVWTRPLEKAFDWEGVCEVAAGDAAHPASSEGRAPSGAPSSAIVSTVLCEVLNSVQVLNDLAQIFNDQTLVEKHINVWKLMQARQL